MAGAHIVAVLFSVAVVLYADRQGSRWLLGKVETLPAARVARMHMLASIGLAALLLTGGLMFIDRASFLMPQPIFWVKMGFVATLVINGFFIGTLSRYATESSFKALSQNKKRWVLISGGISAFGWVSTILCGIYISSVS